MTSAPASSADVVQVATPVAAFTVAGALHEIGFPPTVKLTVPVGPTGAIVTPARVAVNVTAALRFDAAEGEIVSVGLSWLTVWLMLGAIADAKLPSPG